MPWSNADGFTNDELLAAVRTGDGGWLARLFDEAVAIRWIRALAVERQPDSDAWLKFLTLAHCAARRQYHSKRAAMIAAIKKGLDVSRTSQDDEDWARRLIAARWRDPVLARV